jgi:hypothetical protein
LDQPTADRKSKKFVTFSLSHTPGERVTIAIPFASPAGEPPGQDKGGGGQPSTLDMHIDQSISASCQFAK